MNKLSIEVVWSQDLSEALKDTLNVDYDDFSHFMIVKHGDKIISVVDDRMEPEDATFTRDLKWIAKLLGEVYELGMLDGRD